MQHVIQPHLQCENCIKCGSRPVVERLKKVWVISCPNKDCKNAVESELVDLDKWNRANKKHVSIAAEKLKNTA